MSHLKASSFRVCRHPIIRQDNKNNSTPSQWAWLYQLPIERWDQLIEANIQEEESGADDSVFYVMKPDSDQVIECPREIALQAYRDVLDGKTAPAPSGALSTSTIKKLADKAGLKMRNSASESFM